HFLQPVKHGDHEHPPGPDPHAWLGLDEAVAMVKEISTILQKLDPSHAAEFQKRGDAYVQGLDALRKLGHEQFRGKTGSLVPIHDSLGYFARTFGLKVLDKIHVRPGLEADGQKFQELINR